MSTPMGSTWGTTYANGAGAANFLPTTGVDPSSNTTTFGYDTPGNQVSSKNAMAATALVTYNPDGTVATSTDPNNAPKGVATPMASTTYRYDGGHNLTSITPPASGDNTMAVRTLTYDGFGRTATVTTGAVSTTYTKTNQVSSSARAGTSPTNTTYTYAAAGNILTLADGRGTTTYHYNKAEELDQVTESGGNIDLFGYDTAHQVADTYENTSGTTLLASAGFAVHQHSLLDSAGRLRETITTRASSDAATGCGGRSLGRG